jgi:hypothetical protein
LNPYPISEEFAKKPSGRRGPTPKERNTPLALLSFGVCDFRIPGRESKNINNKIFFIAQVNYKNLILF